MFRSYENPRALEEQLKELQTARDELYRMAQEESNPYRKDALFDQWFDTAQEEEELKERINFAWQDEEYDEIAGGMF